MPQDGALFSEFLRITDYLNSRLHIIPVLFGSLGLQVASEVELNPQDVDVLVPVFWLQRGWSSLEAALEALGYQFIDSHEHEFCNGGVTVAFASEEDLSPFAGVDHTQLEQVTFDGSVFRQLSLAQYLRVYSASLKDGYRRTKKDNKDLQKVELLRNLLGE